ncbi:MAG TPA: hypothetical protein VLB12_00475 [Gemmatimonadales bacterium]|nr:hypothetical protein [Gemmatimonadales bacterium]
MEAGFGGPPQTFALATGLIPAGAAGVHPESQNPANRSWKKSLQKFGGKGLEALADLQIEQDAAAGEYPSTKMNQKFAGMNRWLIMESVLSQRT